MMVVLILKAFSVWRVKNTFKDYQDNTVVMLTACTLFSVLIIVELLFGSHSLKIETKNTLKEVTDEWSHLLHYISGQAVWSGHFTTDRKRRKMFHCVNVFVCLLVPSLPVRLILIKSCLFTANLSMEQVTELPPIVS